MRALRLLALVIIGGVVTIGVFADQRDRDLDQIAPPVVVATPDSQSGTWFCAGGSSAGGPAAVGLEVINAGADDATVEVIVVRDDAEGERVELDVAALSREPVNLSQLAGEARWVGAIVEVDDADVVVEQVFDGFAGTDRSPCSTLSASSLSAADGATRVLQFGEEMTLLLMNPFREDAVADITFDADVGLDSLEAVVVPARRVVAIDVTAEVTVASRVHTLVEVVSGRLVGQRIQLRNDATIRGLAVTPLTQRGAEVAVLPALRTELGMFDRVHVTNPSSDQIAEVDLEIVTDGSMTLDPIELTVRPGRTAVVDVASESRLAALGDFSIIARSLTGAPVAVAVERAVVLGSDIVPGTAAMPAIDAASTAWSAPLDGNSAAVTIVNPSPSAIATIEVVARGDDGSVERQQFELGPNRRLRFDGPETGARTVVEVQSSAPVVVAREIEGFTSRQMSSAVAIAGVIELTDVP